MALGSIYLITHLPTGRGYVGQTRRSVATRWNNHLAHARWNQESPISRALRKYGPSQFTLTVLEQCETNALNARETHWIATLGTYEHGFNATTGGDFEYNVSPATRQKHRERMLGARNPNYGKPMPESQRRQLAIRYTGEGNPFYGRSHSAKTKHLLSDKLSGANHPHYGQTFSDEHRQRIGDAKRGVKNPNYGKPLSPETKAKLSEVRRGAKNGRAKLTEEQVHQIRECSESSRALAESFQVSMSTIQRIRNGSSWKVKTR